MKVRHYDGLFVCLFFLSLGKLSSFVIGGKLRTQMKFLEFIYLFIDHLCLITYILMKIIAKSLKYIP